MVNTQKALKKHLVVTIKNTAKPMTKIISKDEYYANLDLKKVIETIASLSMLGFTDRNNPIFQGLYKMQKERTKLLIDNFKSGVYDCSLDYDSARELSEEEYRDYIIAEILK